MASAVSAAEDADQAFDQGHLNQYTGHDFDEAVPSGSLIARPPSSRPPRTADGRPFVSSRRRSAHPSCLPHTGTNRASLRAVIDYGSMTIGELREAASKAGVAHEAIEHARDGNDPRTELIILITARTEPEEE
jgi:hypothetical protein